MDYLKFKSMFNKSFILVVVLVLCGSTMNRNGQISAQNLSFLSDSVSYLWPTDASTYLSSTFGETRSAHLHSGIDIRTWGREGYEVYATRDGSVHRIGIGPGGYGKVIYLQHADQSYSVYAHLHRFEPALQAFADSIRLEKYDFELKKQVKELSFKYKKGDIIGYSGSTGVGPPHLHFELRTPDYIPFNPLLTNLQVSDNIPPVFSSLAVESLNSGTLSFLDYEILQPEQERSGSIDFGTVYTSTPIGLSVDVHDRANRTSNKYAVHQLLMKAGEDTLFHSTADHFRIQDSRMMFLDRSYPILARTRKGFQRLFVVNGNSLPLYTSLQNRGILAFDKGTYEVEIIATDIYGNQTAARVEVVFEENLQRAGILSVPAYPMTTKEIMKFPRNQSGTVRKEIPIYTISGLKFDNNRKPETKKTLWMSPDKNISKKTLYPGNRNTLTDRENKLWINIPSDALYDTLSVSMQQTLDTSDPAIRFTPNRLPLRKPMTINIILPDDIANDPQIGLFSYDEFRDRKTFLSSEIKNGILIAELKEFADLLLEKDITAPWVGRPDILQEPGGMYVVKIPAVDRESGIDYRRSTISVNGNPGIVEYDKDDNRLIYYHPEFKPSDINQAEVTVYDRVGNQVKRTFTIR